MVSDATLSLKETAIGSLSFVRVSDDSFSREGVLE